MAEHAAEECAAWDCSKPRLSDSQLCAWHDVNGEPEPPMPEHPADGEVREALAEVLHAMTGIADWSDSPTVAALERIIEAYVAARMAELEAEVEWLREAVSVRDALLREVVDASGCMTAGGGYTSCDHRDQNLNALGYPANHVFRVPRCLICRLRDALSSPISGGEVGPGTGICLLCKKTATWYVHSATGNVVAVLSCDDHLSDVCKKIAAPTRVTRIAGV